MNHKISYIFLAAVFGLTSCDFSILEKFGIGSKTEIDQKESENNNKEEKDNNEEQKGDNEEQKETTPISYVEWPVSDVEIVVKGINKSSDEIIPAFSKATEISIDWDLYLEEGYFGIYCKTNDVNLVFEYKTILENAGWDISDVVNDGFYDAFSPEGTLWINFGYDLNYTELLIYVTQGFFIHWPERKITEYLQLIQPETETVIPPIDATSYVVNYYPSNKAIAVNIFGLDKNSVTSYKAILESNAWYVEKKENDNEYEAHSPDENVKLDIYYDESKSELNIDIFAYTKPIGGWPYSEIQAVLDEMGVTGEVLPYLGKNNGFTVDIDYYPPAIIVYVDSGTQLSSAQAYNQYLLDSGYVIAGKKYGETIYYKKGTTLAYHGTYLQGNCFTIELYNISELDAYED